MEHNEILVPVVRVNATCQVCGKPIVKGDDTVWQRVNDKWHVWHESCGSRGDTRRGE